MIWPNLESLWEIAKSALAGVLVAGTMVWRSWRHVDGRFDALERQMREEKGRVDLLEQRIGGLARREDLSAIRQEIGEVETLVAGVAEAVKGLSRHLDTQSRQIELLLDHAMNKKGDGK